MLAVHVLCSAHAVISAAQVVSMQAWHAAPAHWPVAVGGTQAGGGGWADAAASRPAAARSSAAIGQQVQTGGFSRSSRQEPPGGAPCPLPWGTD